MNGERLDVDILNMYYDTCEDIVLSSKETNNFDEFKLNIFRILGFDFDMQKEDFEKKDPNLISSELYDKLLTNYNSKNEIIKSAALPVLKRIYKEKGATVKKF